LGWIILAGVAGFLTMGYDKLRSKFRKGRLPEKTLWMIALVGGFCGIVLGSIVFHHKTKKRRFWPPVIASTMIWVVLIWATISYP
jgi:uncharacterized membrane protein YsdA (DUF1294 family)